MSISSEMARKVLEACKQRARELRSPVSIAVVDAGGHLVLFERMMAPYGFATGDMAIAKASTAVMFNQSTDSVAQWGAAIPGFAASLASMTDGKFIMAAGGWPIRINQITIGGIGISGGNAPGRDDEIAQAGLSALGAQPPVPGPYPVPATTPTPPQATAPASRYNTESSQDVTIGQHQTSYSGYTQSLGADTRQNTPGQPASTVNYQQQRYQDDASQKPLEHEADPNSHSGIV